MNAEFDLSEFSISASLTQSQEDILSKQNLDLTHPTYVLWQLKQGFSRDSHCIEFVRGIMRRSIFSRNLLEASIFLERTILPYTEEILSGGGYKYLDAAIKGVIGKANNLDFQNSAFQKPYVLSSNTAKVGLMIAEVRIIVALGSQSLSFASRDKVMSKSGDAYLLTTNTALHLLIKRRASDINRIIEVIHQEQEIDGNRIEMILDADHSAISTGVL